MHSVSYPLLGRGARRGVNLCTDSKLLRCGLLSPAERNCDVHFSNIQASGAGDVLHLKQFLHAKT